MSKKALKDEISFETLKRGFNFLIWKVSMQCEAIRGEQK